MVGNVVLGDVTGNLTMNFSSGQAIAQAPYLVWHELPEDPDEIFKMLSWQVRLTPTFGRERELAHISDWIRHTRSPRIRFISGLGGAGKTRLAAETADRFRQEGWSAGLWRLDRPAILPLREKGLLLIVDYPEEQRAMLHALLRDLSTLESTPAPIRLMLLSRQPFEWWRDVIDAAGASQIVDHQNIALESLTEDAAAELFKAASDRLSEHYGRTVEPRSESEIRRWIAQDGSTHTLPLFVSAAAIHSVLVGSNTLTFHGSKIVSELVRHERRRLNGAGRSAGLGTDGLARLTGLAAASGELDATALQRLAEPRLQLGVPPPVDVVDAVRQAPGWNGALLPAPTPDVLAAELLAQVLEQRHDVAHEWMWAAIETNGPELTDRLGRVLYDLGIVSVPHQRLLQSTLIKMVRAEPNRAARLDFVVTGQLPVGLEQLGIEICQILLTRSDGGLVRATLLTNFSNCLNQAGEYGRALTAARNAVEIWRRLAAEDPAHFEEKLAIGLFGLSHRLIETGSARDALDAINEAIGIWTRLAVQNPRHFESVANGFNNLSNCLSELGDRAGALEAIRKAVALKRWLATQDPHYFDPALAGTLNNLSSRLSDTGNHAGALAAIQEAVGLWRQVAAQDPGRYEPELAGSLNNLSTQLRESGHHARALDTIREAVAIRRRLTAQNPGRFEADLARSLNNLSNCLSDGDDHVGALAAIRESVQIRRGLADKSPARYEPELADGLYNLSACLSEVGHRADALKTIKKAVEIHRRLTAHNPVRWGPMLAQSLNLLSSCLRDVGESAGALEAIRESIQIRRRLAAANPALFELMLARGLNNLSRCLSEVNDVGGALDAIGEAIEIWRRLAAQNPTRFGPDLADSLNELRRLRDR